jgi:hypothetical protein
MGVALMQWSEIPREPSDRVLRQFAALLVGFAVLLWWHGISPLVLIVALVGAAGLVRPKLVRRLYFGWMVAVFPIGWLLSRAFLGLVFFGIVTPLGLAFRLIGRDTLRLRRRSEEVSIWTPRTAPTDERRYFCQY